jgi:HlyD family secretion protein
MRLVTWIVVLVAAATAVAFIVNGNVQRDAKLFEFKWSVAPEVPLQVTLDAATMGKIVRTVAAPGQVEAEIEVEISSQVPGRIERMPAAGENPSEFSGQLREGDSVKRNQVIVTLDSRIYKERLRQAEAQAKRIERSLAGTQADVDKARRDVERNRRLAKNFNVGPADVADMETMLELKIAAHKGAIEELEAANANIAQIKKDLEECTIRSPMDGVVSKRPAEEGENVVLGTMNNAGTVIMTVSDMNSVVVRARIDETYVPLVKAGQLARVFLQWDNEQVLMGRVKRVFPAGEKGNNQRKGGGQAPAVDPNELAKFDTLIAIDNPPPSLRLGMTANVEIIVDERHDALGIAPHAVLQRRAKDLPTELTSRFKEEKIKRKGFEDPAKRWFQVVFVEENGRASTRVVKTGVSDENRVELLSDPNDPKPIKAGDRIVTGPFRVFDKLKEGSTIEEYSEAEAAKTKASS